MSPPPGWKHSPAARAKIGDATRARWRDPAYKAFLSAQHVGRTLPPKWRKAISRGRSLPPMTAAERKHYRALRPMMSRKEAIYWVLRTSFSVEGTKREGRKKPSRSFCR